MICSHNLAVCTPPPVLCTTWNFPSIWYLNNGFAENRNVCVYVCRNIIGNNSLNTKARCSVNWNQFIFQNIHINAWMSTIELFNMHLQSKVDVWGNECMYSNTVKNYTNEKVFNENFFIIFKVFKHVNTGDLNFCIEFESLWNSITIQFTFWYWNAAKCYSNKGGRLKFFE